MYRNPLSLYASRAKNLLVAFLFIAIQLAIPLSTVGFFDGQASAAVACITDTAGANDQPGQKDLNKLCIDDGGLPTSQQITFNFDEVGVTGANTLDGCALFDTNNNGNVDYAVCVTATGTPATLLTTTLYTCGDAKIDRCTTPAVPYVPTAGTACTINQLATDPFPGPPNNKKGDGYPNDTVANCTIYASDVGGQNAKLVDVCSFSSSQPNSDPSDCVVIQARAGKIELVKKLVPTTDSGKFNLLIDSVVKASNVGHNGTTGEVVVTDGNHSISETAGTLTDLNTYTTAIECKNLNGTGTVVASGTTTSISSVPVADGSDIVCIITNTLQQATLTLVKTVVNDNGGTLSESSFPVTINGTTAQWGANTVSPGTFTVSETTQTGYQPSAWGGACSATGSVTLATGESKTCTITNDDISPQLTVIKQVTNDNGGTAVSSDFTMNVTGTNVSDASFSGAASPGTTVTLNAGSYSVDESPFTGYAKTLGANCSGTIALGETKTCTVTNNDVAPILSLIKNVTNDNGGTAVATDWNLSATPTSGQTLSGDGGFSNQSAQAGMTYTLSETGPNTYSASSWSCNGGSLTGNTLTMNVGSNVTCQITNDDIAPTLTVNKVVINNNGGTLTVSDFPLFVGNLQVTSGATNSFSSGNYVVSETQQPGYSLISISGDCLADGSITLVIGGVYTCTITNDDRPATITVTKNVVNDNGGTAAVNNFNLFVNSTQVVSGVSNTFAANQSYTVSEVAQVNGYSQTSLTCVDSQTQASLGATFTPTNGQQIACQITNDDISPELTVIKQVVNDNGGTAVASDFSMNVTGTNVSDASFNGAASPGTTVTLNAGSYSVDESPFAGYAKTLGANCSGTIALGETKTCVITNDDEQATLTLTKTVINDNGGDETADDFQAYVDTTAVDWSVATSLNAGDYTASEDQLPGWLASTWGGDCLADGSVSLAPGENKTCSITNDDLPPTLTIVKNVVNDNGGDAQAGEFTVRVNDAALIGAVSTNGGLTATYSFASPEANTSYTVTEDAIGGYTLTSLTCADNANQAVVDQPVLLNEGQNVTCTLTNTANEPVLNLTKDNNRPEPTVTGDTVTYTLEVTVPEDSGEVFGAVVTDLPPNNFEYVPGSWTAQSSERGDLKADGITTEPTYGSPGDWQLGNVIPGERIVLTYLARIGTSVTDGSYPDLAFVKGASAPTNGTTVLGNLSPASTPFVATQVAVFTAASTQVFTAGQVLGAEILVNTGTAMLTAQYILPIFLIASVFFIRRATYNQSRGGI